MGAFRGHQLPDRPALRPALFAHVYERPDRRNNSNKHDNSSNLITGYDSRVVLVGDPMQHGPNGQWVNPNSILAPLPGVSVNGIGNASKAPIYGPGLNNFDISLVQEFPAWLERSAASPVPSGDLQHLQSHAVQLARSRRQVRRPLISRPIQRSVNLTVRPWHDAWSLG